MLRLTTIFLMLVALLCSALRVGAVELSVYILTGQSNALGTTDLEGSTAAQYGPGVDPADAGTRFFWSNVSTRATAYPPLLSGDSQGTITTLQMQQGEGPDPAYWGPEFGFARTMAAAGQPNVLIVKVSRGGGGNTTWDKEVFEANPNAGHMWGALRDGVGDALTAAQKAGYRVKVKGLLYLQGESNNAADASASDVRLSSLIASLREYINSRFDNAASDMQTIVGEIAASASNANRALTTAKQQSLANGHSDIAFIQTHDQPLKSDNLHFGRDAKLVIGRRFADAFLSLQSPSSSAMRGAVGSSRAEATPATVRTLSEHVLVYHGPTNVGIVQDGAKALLFDCGEGSVQAVLPKLGIATVDEIWFTHHHRDLACGAHALGTPGTKIRVPAAERPYFEDAAAYWEDPKNRWRAYNPLPHQLVLAESLRVDAALSDGQTIAWGPAKITVISTPGHTDGSLSYLVEADGKRVVFCGDALFDAGQVWNLWSLQKGTVTTDYHGFLGARPQLEQSLGRIQAARPDALVPSHGRIMTAPGEAIELLVRRLDVAYDKYVATSALRGYFPKVFADYAGKADHMPIRPGKPVPACLRHFDTTWMLVSQDKAALVMDCGNPAVVETIQAMLAKGEIGSVEGLWVTHYHFDHTDGIPAFQKAFPNGPCITDRSVAEVIGDPMAWRLPCLSPDPVRVERPTNDGESWQWHEFKLTAYHLPGQTLYHSGLLVEGQGLRMLFVGDSFTMAGIDDYCMPNRNWLGQGVGFEYCLDLIQRLQPTHIFNCHVDTAFDFTDQECRFMHANLAERERLYGELVPWDHANYGMDDSWVRCAPYEQPAKAGQDVTLEVVITNHSSQAHTASCRPILPRAWGGGATNPAWPSRQTEAQPPTWAAAQVPAKSDGHIRISLRIPSDAKPGRYAIPIDVWYGPWALPQCLEAIVVL